MLVQNSSEVEDLLKDINFSDTGGVIEDKAEISVKDAITLKFEKERADWTAKVATLAKISKVLELQEHLVTLYSERQFLVENYHYILSLIITINKQYRKQYAIKYDYYSNKTQIRFPNENVKNNQILSDLEDLVIKKDLLELHAKFMMETLKTIDHIIWGCQRVIEIEKIKRGG
jgi:hypothetical protein